MLLERFQFVKSMLPDDEGVIYIVHPKSGFVPSQLKSLLFKRFHENIGYKLEHFQKHLNCLRDPIKFTMETETKGQLPFLDVLVKRDGNKLTTSIFRKRTHNDQYLHYRSHHHPQIKAGIISCLRHRPHNLCKVPELRHEISHLQQTSETNKYPPRIVHKALHKHRPSPAPEIEVKEKARILTIPYIKGFNEKIERAVQAIEHQSCLQDPDHHTTESCEG